MDSKQNSSAICNEDDEPSESSVEMATMVEEGTTVPQKALNAQTALVLDALGGAAWVTDTDGKITWANAAAGRMMGLRPRDLIGLDPSGIMVMRQTDEPHQDVTALCSDELTEPRSGACTLFRPDGATWGMNSVTWKLIRNGQPDGFLVLFRETLNKSEEAMARREEVYRSIFDHGLEGMFQSTPDGRYLAVNRALAQMYGYANEEELKSACTDIGHQLYVEPERREEFMRLMLEDGHVSGYESQIRRSDGTTLWISETARRVCDCSGNPLYFEGTVQDISRRKRAEDALRESQRFIQRVADTSPTILYVYDILERRCLYANHQIEKVLGYTVEDFVSRPPDFLSSLVHPEDKYLAEERYRRLEAAEEGQVFESCFRLKNIYGEWLWVLTRDMLFTRDGDGRPEQIIGMAQDVTTSKESQGTLERSREQLRALSTRLQQVREEERVAIAREVHDELGQTLTALNMDISRIRSRMARLPVQNDAELTERLASMEQHIDSMLFTVRKISSELRPPLLDECGLAVAIEWQGLQFQKRYGIRCEVLINWTIAVVDQQLSTAVFRIFQEILTNVARHAKASKVVVELKQSAHSLLLVVKDNGKGITESEKSASLGLLGMRERALLFGGDVDIHGVSGRGTTVTVRIPIAAVITQDGRKGVKGLPKKETTLGSKKHPRS